MSASTERVSAQKFLKGAEEHLLLYLFLVLNVVNVTIINWFCTLYSLNFQIMLDYSVTCNPHSTITMTSKRKL